MKFNKGDHRIQIWKPLTSTITTTTKNTATIKLLSAPVTKRKNKTNTHSADEARLLLRSRAGMAAGCSSVAIPSRSTHNDLDRSLAADMAEAQGGAVATLSRRPPGSVDGGGAGTDGWFWPSRLSPAATPRRRDTSFMVADDGARSQPSPTPPPPTTTPLPTDDRRRHVRGPVLEMLKGRGGPSG